MNSPPFKTGDIVKYNGFFKDLLGYLDDHNIDTESPMIIIESKVAAIRPSLQSDMTDDAEIEYCMFDVLQGDKKFEISDAWVELIE